MSPQKCRKTSSTYILRSKLHSSARSRSSIGLVCFLLMQSFLLTSPSQLADSFLFGVLLCLIVLQNCAAADMFCQEIQGAFLLCVVRKCFIWATKLDLMSTNGNEESV